MPKRANSSKRQQYMCLSLHFTAFSSASGSCPGPARSGPSGRVVTGKSLPAFSFKFAGCFTPGETRRFAGVLIVTSLVVVSARPPGLRWRATASSGPSRYSPSTPMEYSERPVRWETSASNSSDIFGLSSTIRGRGSRLFLESRRFVRAAGRIAGAVGMRPRPGQLAAVNDQVLFANRAALEPAFQDLAGPGGVSRLCRQTGA